MPNRNYLMTILIVLGLLVPVGVRAVSTYSMILVGERLDAGDVRAVSLGGSQQILVDSLAAVSANPALLSKLPRVTIGASQFVGIDQGRSDDYRERDISVAFTGLRIVFPVYNLFRFSIGYMGRFDPEGGFVVDDATESDDVYTTTYTRSGGLFSIPLTASFDVTRFASVGLTFSLEDGSVEERWDVVFEDPLYEPSGALRKVSMSGTGYAAGLVLFPLDGLTIGGMWESGIDYDSDVREQFRDLATVDTSYTRTVKLPSRVNAGISWRVANRFLLLASYTYSDFKKFEGLSFPVDRLAEEKSYALGLEYLPGISLKGKRMPLRLGFNYQTLPFDYPQGEPLKKFLVSLGTGFSIKNGMGKIDLALQFGQAGSLKNNGIEDRLIRVYVGICGSELWKRKGGRNY